MTDLASTQASKFGDRSATIGIIGLGYVGLPLALRYSEARCRTIGFEIDAERLARLREGYSYLSFIDDARVVEAMGRGLSFQAEFSAAAGCDALILCLPTPVDRYREPDLGAILEALDELLPHLRRGQLIALESTTWPGTTEEVLPPLLEQAGFRIGEDLFLVFSPERIDPGNMEFDVRSTPKLLAGVTAACTALGKACYELAVDRVVPVSSTRVAEMAKLMENVQRAVNIGLANEMKKIADLMGIDIFEVIEAAATKPFGFVPCYPGPGLGGHCVPVDPHYLTW